MKFHMHNSYVASSYVATYITIHTYIMYLYIAIATLIVAMCIA